MGSALFGYTARQVGISVWVSKYGAPVGHMTLLTPCENEAQLLEVLLAHIKFRREQAPALREDKNG